MNAVITRNSPLEMTMVAAIHYIGDKLGLPEGDTIQLDFFGDEGRELQAIVNRWEGSTRWDFPASDESEKEIENDQFKCLLGLLKAHNLCIQFTDTYPCVVGNGNFRALISAIKTTQERLHRCEGTIGTVFARKALQPNEPSEDARSGPIVAPAPVLNGFKGHPAKSRKPRKLELATP